MAGGEVQPSSAHLSGGLPGRILILITVISRFPIVSSARWGGGFRIWIRRPVALARCFSPMVGFFFGRPPGGSRLLVRVPGSNSFDGYRKGVFRLLFSKARISFCLPLQSLGGKQGAGGRHAACT